jgi:hypothetical protein
MQSFSLVKQVVVVVVVTATELSMDNKSCPYA